MLKSFTHAGVTSSLFLAVTLPCVPAEIPSKLEALQGKWSVSKTNTEGQRFSQSMEFINDRLTFRRTGDDDKVQFAAKAVVKGEKAGPFDILSFSQIEAGRSLDDLQSVEDTRSVVYTLREDKLMVASNFDRKRDNEPPGVDSYVRKEPAKKAGEADESKLLGTWKAKITYGENELDYDLRISKALGNLEAILISPRSGDHKCKSATYKAGELVMEIDRDIQGTDVTFTYKAKLTAEGLSGTVDAKGLENQLNGSWKATK